MGLFDLFSKKKTIVKQNVKTEKDAMALLDKVDPSFRKRQADLEYQNKLLDRVNAAREKYKEDKDLEKAIEEYEFAFVKSNPPCLTSQDIDLADLYMKAGQNDKAWGYLNQLMMRRTSPDPHIRFMQAKILKKEEKYAYAIEMFALGYYYKSIPNMAFQEDKFQKDIASSVKKLGWDQEKVNGIIKIVKSVPHKDNFAEDKLVKQLRAFMGCE